MVWWAAHTRNQFPRLLPGNGGPLKPAGRLPWLRHGVILDPESWRINFGKGKNPASPAGAAIRDSADPGTAHVDTTPRFLKAIFNVPASDKGFF